LSRRFRRRSERTETGDHVERQRDRRPLEVGAGEDAVLLAHEDRVVGHAVELDLELLAGVRERVAHRADHLRRRAHRVGVLHLNLELAGDEVGAVHHLAQVGGAGDRAGEAAQLVELALVRFHVGEQRLERHGGRDLGLLDPAVGVVEDQAADPGDQVGAVDGGETVAGLQPGYGDAGLLHRLGRRHPLALVEALAFAHERERELAHRGQVAARADAALLAHDGCHALVEHVHVRQGDFGAAAGVPATVHVDARDHRRAHVLDRGRPPDPRGVVVDQVLLELLDLLVGEHHLGELADPGVDAVHDLVGGDLLLEHPAALGDALDGVGRELHLLAVPRNVHHVFDGEILSLQGHRHGVVLPDGSRGERQLRRPQ
jgi:hypothetical protein